MRKVLCFLVFVVMLSGCGPKIEQDVQLDRVTADGECIYETRAYIWKGNSIIYSTWKSNIRWHELEQAKADQMMEVQRIMDSGCLDPLL